MTPEQILFIVGGGVGSQVIVYFLKKLFPHESDIATVKKIDAESDLIIVTAAKEIIFELRALVTLFRKELADVREELETEKQECLKREEILNTRINDLEIKINLK